MNLEQETFGEIACERKRGIMCSLAREQLASTRNLNIKVAHISSGYSTYLNHDNEMIARDTIVYAKSDLMLRQECLDRVYIRYLCDTFKINNAFVYHFLKVFTDIDTYVVMQDEQDVFFTIHEQPFSLDHVTR